MADAEELPSAFNASMALNLSSPAALLSAPELPPQLAATRDMSADELLKMLNSTPLFMTELDDPTTAPDASDASAPNLELEAMKALVHEGTPGERAQNFKDRGNEVISEGRLIAARRAKAGTVGGGVRWAGAREFYTQALSALAKPAGSDEDTAETVPEAQRAATEEACYVNRALCNLELKNYGACTRDCAAVLRRNPRHVKALYRSATACLALDKLPAAMDVCERALALDASNAAAQMLMEKIKARVAALQARQREREEKRARASREAAALKKALADRGIATRRTAEPPADVEDARVTLAAPEDSTSALTVPVLLLYPTHAQSDLIKAFGEDETLAVHLGYILPVPWDADGEFGTSDAVECFMDTAAGGMVKVGKKVPLGKMLAGGKVELVDGLGRIYVVPKGRVSEWVADVKKRRGKS